MRGSIRKRGDTYRYRVDLPPDPLTGKRRQAAKGGFRTRRECEAALNQVLSALRSGTFVEASRRTVASFVRDEWLPAVQPPVLRPTTWATHRTHFEVYVFPTLGEVELQRLTPAMLTGLYRKLQEGGRRRTPGGLSLRTVRNTHAALHRALRDAVRWGYVVRNVADLIDAPKPTPTDMKFWAPVQLRLFLKTVSADRLSAMWVLFATTGMRRGEVAGLRWVDVDFEAPRLLVRTPRVTVDREIVVSEPKTTRSRRSVSLDPVTVIALKAWRERQEGERAFVGRGYVESGLVFTMPDGSPISPHNITDWFESWARKAGLPRIRLHDMRHSYASAGLAAGVPPKVISERLGHANIGITMDTYSHVMPQLDQEAANKVADLIFGDDDEGSSDGS
jgi:integrase